MQQIVDMVKETYLADICNHTMKAINDTLADMITHLQENYGQLMPCKLLERKDIVKKMTYHPQEPITSIFSAVKEFIKFSNITGTCYTKLQAVNIAYMIIQSTCKYGTAICEWDHMSTVQKTWVRFKNFF